MGRQALYVDANGVDPSKSVTRVAVTCGAAGEFLADAIRSKADVFLTGEMRYWVKPDGVDGPAELEDVRLRVGDAFRITPGTVHYMQAVTDCDVLEASTPELDDVVRLKDRYGREGTSAA